MNKMPIKVRIGVKYLTSSNSTDFSLPRQPLYYLRTAKRREPITVVVKSQSPTCARCFH